MATFSDDRDTPWRRICRGELCPLCEQPLTPPHTPAFRYCTLCAPTPADTPRWVNVHIDHWDGWSVVLIAQRNRRWRCSLHNLTDAQLDRLVQRLPLAPTEREDHPRAMASWGRNYLHGHLHRRQARFFAWACRRQMCLSHAHRRRSAC